MADPAAAGGGNGTANLEPKQDGGDYQHRLVIAGPLLVSRGDPSPLLQAVDEALHHIAFSAGYPVEGRV
jgi:hypothetical protein